MAGTLRLTQQEFERIAGRQARLQPSRPASMVALPITPVAKPRMVHSDRWKTRAAVVRYRAFADTFRQLWHQYGDERLFADGVLCGRFEFPMPPSWSKAKKERMLWQAHTQKPDADNVAKAVADILWAESTGGDAHIWAMHAHKVWGPEGKILLMTWECYHAMVWARLESQRRRNP